MDVSRRQDADHRGDAGARGGGDGDRAAARHCDEFGVRVAAAGPLGNCHFSGPRLVRFRSRGLWPHGWLTDLNKRRRRCRRWFRRAPRVARRVDVSCAETAAAMLRLRIAIDSILFTGRAPSRFAGNSREQVCASRRDFTDARLVCKPMQRRRLRRRRK
jgi:hypothetical protein